MKTLINSIKFMMMLAVTIAVTSCQKESSPIDEPEVPQPPTEELIMVGFKLYGDIAVSEMPLSKATSNDLYGVNVSVINQYGQYGQYYALGIFDDISKLTVNLPKKTKFAIEIFLIKDAKTLFAIGSNGLPTDRPFEVSGAMNSFDTPTLTLNEISYSRECDLYGYNYTLKNGGTCVYPQLVLYSGYKTGLEATRQNEIFTIPLWKASFGVTVNVVNMTPGDKVAVYLAARFSDKPFYVTDTFSGIFSYVPSYAKQISQIIEPEHENPVKTYYSEIEDMQVDLIKADGSKTTILKKTMEYKRNVMTSFTLDISELVPSSGTVDTPLDNNPMTDETVNI